MSGVRVLLSDPAGSLSGLRAASTAPEAPAPRRKATVVAAAAAVALAACAATYGVMRLASPAAPSPFAAGAPAPSWARPPADLRPSALGLERLGRWERLAMARPSVVAGTAQRPAG